MHKKYSKFSHKERHHHASSSRRGGHVKSKKGTDDSAFQIIEVPQNSRNESDKNLNIDKENFRSHKHKHKEEVKPKEHHRKKQERIDNVASIHDLVLDKDAIRRKKKKEKREKERLNKIEKYLEGLKKENESISCIRSISLESSEEILKNKEKHIRREKTYHGKSERDISTASRHKSSYGKELVTITTTKEKSHRKYKYEDDKKRGSSKDKNTKEDLKNVMYCQIDTQSPFVQEKRNIDVERLYPKTPNKHKEKSSRRQSSSRDSATLRELESTPKSTKEKHTHKTHTLSPVRISPKRSTAKIDIKHYKDETSDMSCPNKYLVIDKRSHNEKEDTVQKKKKHHKRDSSTNNSHFERRSEAKDKSKAEKTKRKQEKNESHSDPYKVKIEDDIKSYFSKIQSLIDKKLDFILGNSTSKETKNTVTEKDADKKRSKKDKKVELKDRLPVRERSESKRRKKSETRRNADEEGRRERRHDEELKTKLAEAIKESKHTKEKTSSNVIMDDSERHQPEDNVNHRRHRTPQKHRYGSAGDVKYHKRSDSEGNQHKMEPNCLIKMLEHPSTVSISDTSLGNKKLTDEVKYKSKEPEPGPSGANYRRKREKSCPRAHLNADEDNLQMEDLRQAYLQEALVKKLKYRVAKDNITAPVQSNPILNDGSKTKPESAHPGLAVCEQQEHHHKKDNSQVRRNVIPGDEINIDEIEQKYLQEKKLKKRLRQLMNLECKTISIVGIPSQTRESTIFNETQTTTSLNVFPLEDTIEQKKKSKRFKLYYKYSVADNKCPSDKSSDGMKSTVSDSYKVVSDPSDPNIDVWENIETPQNEDKEGKAELTRYFFALNKDKVKGRCESPHKNTEHSTKKYRKRTEGIKPIALNNILEEPSNISITVRRDEISHYSKNDVNCTFFKTLRSSSSDFALGQKKKRLQNWNVPIHRHKSRNVEKLLEEKFIRPKSSSRKDPTKSEKKKTKSDENHESCRKIKKMISHERIKKKHLSDKIRHTSRSDIDISYDSLRGCKLNRENQSSDTSDFIKEQLKEILPELFTQNPSPVRDSLDLILKEEIREIVKELPINTLCKKSFESLDQHPEEGNVKKDNNEIPKDTHDTNVNEMNTNEDSEKRQCPKKTSIQSGTKIPTLIKGYAGTHQAAQVTSEELTETGVSLDQITQHEVPWNVSIKPSVKTLVSVATEISINEKKMEVEEVVLEDKKSQTPNYLESEVERSKKTLAVANNMRHCRIMDSLYEPRTATRTKINLENAESPSRQPSIGRNKRPASAQNSRQKSYVSEKKSEKFETEKETDLYFKRRPVSAQDSYTETLSTLTEKTKRKPTLTMSTNIVTINTPPLIERATDTHDSQKRRDDSCRLVKTCVERTRTREELSSNTNLTLNYIGSESKIADRYNNFLNSNSRSLDQYTTKSTISDNQQNSKLFLTKNFNPELNTYQRRKVYDELIRKKMKKKHGSQNQMGPTVFEVRYLTLENGKAGDGVDGKKAPIINQTCFTKLPTFNTRINKGKQRSKTTTKKNRKNFPKNKEDACKYSGRDIFAPVITDVDQLNKFRRKSFPQEKSEDIFMKRGSKSTTDVGNTSSSAAEEKKQVSKANQNKSIETAGSVNEDFKTLIDCLYNSILTYCNEKFTLPHDEEKTKSLPGVDVEKQQPSQERSYVVLPKTSTDTSKKSSTSEVNIERKHLTTTPIGCHLSCPVLAGSSSSFDYLYEDGPIELNKEAVLLHFRKPMKTILGYALNNVRPLQRHTFRGCPKREDQMSSCATQSDESGYSSNESRKCASVCSFFKRPSIANLFKPVRKLEDGVPSAGSVNICRSALNLQEYNVMNQKCIEYAEKVRIQTQNRKEPEPSFQEIPLDVLLLCRKNSAFLNDFNSNCSLCQKHSDSNLLDVEINDELSIDVDVAENDLWSTKNSFHSDLFKENNCSEFAEGETRPETLIYYGNPTHKPSLEIITFQRSHSFSDTNTPQILSELVNCPVVLSITNLNSSSLTVIEESVSKNHNNFHTELEKLDFDTPAETSSITKLSEGVWSKDKLKSSGQTDTDNKSDISSVLRYRFSNTPSANSKLMAKKFFDNLLKVYEKEMKVTNKLFRDDDFFVNVLLKAVQGEMPKRKGKSFKSLIKGKIKNYIGNVLSFKSESRGKVEGTELSRGSISSHQKRLQVLASDARKYFSMYVEAVRTNKDINDEVKICGLLKLLERIEDGDFTILRKKEEVDFEEEIREQVKVAFINTYHISLKEAKKRKRTLTTDDLNLIRTFVSKYRIGLLSRTDLIATYIGRGVFDTENHLKAAVTYLIKQNKNKAVDLKDFDAHCKSLNCSE